MKPTPAHIAIAWKDFQRDYREKVGREAPRGTFFDALMESFTPQP